MEANGCGRGGRLASPGDVELELEEEEEEEGLSRGGKAQSISSMRNMECLGMEETARWRYESSTKELANETL